MWLMRAKKERYGKLNGKLFGLTFADGIGICYNRFQWQFLLYNDFEDITPDGWEHATNPNIERAIFVHHGGIGDVFFISAVIREYKKQHPNCEIFLSTHGVGAQLFYNNPDIKEIIVDKQQIVPAYIWDDQYDDAVCFDAIIAGNGESTIKNVYDLYLDWAGVAEPENKKPEIYLTNDEKLAMSTWLKEKFSINTKSMVGDKIVVVQTDSSTAIRNIDPLVMRKFVDKLTKDGYKVLLFGSNVNAIDNIESICDTCGDKKTVNIPEEFSVVERQCKCGKSLKVKIPEKNPNVFKLTSLNIRQIAAVISYAAAFVGIDSCGLHIAGALGIPVLGIFSSFDGDLRMRYYDKARWIQKEYRCAPCFIHHIECRWAREQKLKIPPCMAQITEEQIFGEFKKLIAKEYMESKPFEFVDSSCPVCGAKNNKFITRKGNALYFECNNCSVVYAGNYNSDNWYQDDEYYTIYHDEAYINGQKNMAQVICSRLHPKYKFSGSILEIGCGEGDCLAELQRLGWKTKGVEISKLHVEKHKKLGIDVFCGNVFDYETEEKFDVVLLDNVFEHFSNPSELLVKLLTLLKDGGMILLLTPDHDKWDKHNNKWGHANTYYPGEHCLLWNEKSMKYITLKNSIKISKLEKINGDLLWAELEAM